MVDVENIDGVEGVVLNGWQLATLFAREQFNRMIDWDWDDTAQLCLAAAPAIQDSIMEKEWIPDFTAWEHDEFRWALPDRLLSEFAPSFWEQDEVKPFMQKWFNDSLDGYLDQNQELKATFGEKLNTLTESTIPPHQLAAFFDEDTFRIWIGIKENKVPFTLGLKLEEPTGPDDFWVLELFLRDKNNPDLSRGSWG